MCESLDFAKWVFENLNFEKWGVEDSTGYGFGHVVEMDEEHCVEIDCYGEQIDWEGKGCGDGSEG